MDVETLNAKIEKTNLKTHAGKEIYMVTAEVNNNGWRFPAQSSYGTPQRPNPMKQLNVLAKGTGEINSMQDNLDELQATRVWNRAMEDWADQGKCFDLLPKVAIVPLAEVLHDRDIQRALEKKHCRDIVAPGFHPGLLRVLFCIKNSKGEFICIDGQHTATVLAGLVAAGFYTKETDWKKVEFPVQYIETDNLAFARRAFGFFNGKRTKKQSKFQELRNEVYIVRIDKDTTDPNEVATEKKVSIVESYGCYPIPEKSPLAKYPGTFTHIAEFQKLTEEELHITCKWHSMYFSQDPIDGGLWFMIPHMIRGFKKAGLPLSDELLNELAGIIQHLYSDVKTFHREVKKGFNNWSDAHYGYRTSWENMAIAEVLLALYKALGGQHSVPRDMVDKRKDTVLKFLQDEIMMLF